MSEISTPVPPDKLHLYVEVLARKTRQAILCGDLALLDRLGSEALNCGSRVGNLTDDNDALRGKFNRIFADVDFVLLDAKQTESESAA